MTNRQSALIDVRVMLLRGSDVLLIQRNDALFPGCWNLPGGHVGEGENAIRAALRELEEEAAVTVLADHLRFAGVCHYRLASRGPKVGFAFTAHKWSGIPFVTEPERFSAVAWHPLGSLPSALMPHAEEILRMHRSGVQFSVYGWGENTKGAPPVLVGGTERGAAEHGATKVPG
ncbi:MAG TPA: DNA mismatch repair protein MutT [Micromonosporaceae bacterium]|nr:DNA mismatch repair protein MutT [Micromonosporaceae bacterium]HCU48829.1 DNA mismatch repair protein MutT [Micromonosporaceae bacterium]